MTLIELANRLKPYSDNPKLEAKWILEYTKDAKKIQKIIAQRKLGKPLSKIFGQKEFWKYSFYVDDNVLDPRPDSETLIKAILKTFPNTQAPYSILDVGTGSGCLLLTLLKEYPNAIGMGIDISSKAIKIAKKNADVLAVPAKFRKMDMVKLLNQKKYYDFIISNPPYIPSKDIPLLDKTVKNFDPIIALDGGNDGLDYYRILSKLQHIPTIFLEIGKGQKTAVIKIFQKENWKLLNTYKDFGGIIRVLVFHKLTMSKK